MGTIKQLIYLSINSVQVIIHRMPMLGGIYLRLALILLFISRPDVVYLFKCPYYNLHAAYYAIYAYHDGADPKRLCKHVKLNKKRRHTETTRISFLHTHTNTHTYSHTHTHGQYIIHRQRILSLKYHFKLVLVICKRQSVKINRNVDTLYQ